MDEAEVPSYPGAWWSLAFRVIAAAPILPWPLLAEAAHLSPVCHSGYFRGTTIPRVLQTADFCAFVVDQTGRSGCVLSGGLRHLGAAVGSADARPPYLFPFLPSPAAS